MTSPTASLKQITNRSAPATAAALDASPPKTYVRGADKEPRDGVKRQMFFAALEKVGFTRGPRPMAAQEQVAQQPSEVWKPTFTPFSQPVALQPPLPGMRMGGDFHQMWARSYTSQNPNPIPAHWPPASEVPAHCVPIGPSVEHNSRGYPLGVSYTNPVFPGERFVHL